MKILDLSCDVAGRYAAKLFAMAGLPVVRPMVVGQAMGDDTDDLSLYLDCDKRVARFQSREEVLVSVSEADLVFTSFDRGAWQGLAAEPLALPTSCVQVTTSTYGVTGPYAAWRGGPLADWAAGGYFAITGEPEREPLTGPERLCGYVGGYTAAIAAEAALHARRRTGLGQHADISTMEAMLSVHQSTFARVAAGLGRVRTGRYTEAYPLVVRPCRDGHVSLGVVMDSEFDRLVIAMGRPELASDERFADGRARWANRDALDQELAVFLSAHSCDEVVAQLRSFGVATAKVTDTLEILDNPQLAHRGFWRKAVGGGVMPGNPAPDARRFAATGEPPTGALQAWATARDDRGALPLTGTVVLDLTAFWAGPSATRNLADLGATVIKVERPGSRVDLDNQLADPAALVPHLFHCKMNRHKLSITLDLASPEGRDAALRLAGQADVLVENFRPGVTDRLGLGAAQLCAANPSLVYVSLSGYGAAGPWGDLRSYGPNIEAVSSIEARTGYAGGEPLRLGHTLPDGVGGLVGTLAVLRGLREREARGGGWFEISQLEAYVALSGEEILTASKAGRAPPRIGNRSRTGAIQGAFPCRGDDQWVAVRIAGQADAERFATVSGEPEVSRAAAANPRDLDRIEALIAGFTRTLDKHDAARRLQAAGLEAAPIFTPEDLLADPHLRERGFFVTVRADGWEIDLPGSPFHGDRALADPHGVAPRFGADTAEILRLGRNSR